MEKGESQQHRDELAKEMMDAPKEERRDIHDKAKNSPEYWQAQTEKVKAGQEEIDDGLGIFVKHKTLYHGSGVAGIEAFDEAEAGTIGSGVYCTSEAKDAIGYARRRSRREKSPSPIIYESSVEKMKFLDLRKKENVEKILGGFKQVLNEMIKMKGWSWDQQNILQNAIAKINSGTVGVGNLRDVTYGLNQQFSDYCESQGYGGLIAIEGGEGDDIGNHDTYLIFDPEDAKIVQEHKIT